MKNKLITFMKKLSQRELGFIYIFLYIIIGYIYNLVPISLKLSYIYTLSPIVILIRIFLLIKGLIKIFSKKPNGIINEKSNNSTESIIWIIFGILSSTSIFWFMFLCNLLSKQKEVCGILGIYSIFILLPSMIVGIVCIIIGIFKLNKYSKQKKSNQNTIKNN